MRECVEVCCRERNRSKMVLFPCRRHHPCLAWSLPWGTTDVIVLNGIRMFRTRVLLSHTMVPLSQIKNAVINRPESWLRMFASTHHPVICF